MNETKEVYDDLHSIVPESNSGGSGIPQGFSFKHPCVQMYKDSETIFIFPPSGGCIALRRDGTWAGDIAPFSD